MKLFMDDSNRQGGAEYVFILLLILGAVLGLYLVSVPPDRLRDIYDTVTLNLHKITGDAYYDTGDTSKKYGVWHNVNRGIAYEQDDAGPYYVFHKTFLTYTNGKTAGEVWWFINGAGYKEYKVGKNNDKAYGRLQWVPKTVVLNGKTTVDEAGTDGPAYSTTYFQATDGNIYKIQYFPDNPFHTVLSLYEGDPAVVMLVDTATFSGYVDGKFRKNG